MKKILIVEDHADIRDLIRMALEPGQFDIHETDSCELGLAMVSSLRPDLVLLDIMMPGEMDGLQLCRHIKSDPKLKRIKVVMLSARSQESDVVAGRQAGANGYLVKPFSPLELGKVVSRQIG